MLQESFPTVWHMKNMLESFKKDHQVKENLKISNVVLSTQLIMLIGHLKEFRKLAFRALALRQSE